jgi:hypothetical protein
VSTIDQSLQGICLVTATAAQAVTMSVMSTFSVQVLTLELLDYMYSSSTHNYCPFHIILPSLHMSILIFLPFRIMSKLQEQSEQSLEKSVAGSEKDIEIDSIRDVEPASPKGTRTAAQASGDRVLVLMDLDSGLVGWESEKDPDNPQ